MLKFGSGFVLGAELGIVAVLLQTADEATFNTHVSL